MCFLSFLKTMYFLSVSKQCVFFLLQNNVFSSLKTVCFLSVSKQCIFFVSKQCVFFLFLKQCVQEEAVDIIPPRCSFKREESNSGRCKEEMPGNEALIDEEDYNIKMWLFYQWERFTKIKCNVFRCTDLWVLIMSFLNLLCYIQILQGWGDWWEENIEQDLKVGLG